MRGWEDRRPWDEHLDGPHRRSDDPSCDESDPWKCSDAVLDGADLSGMRFRAVDHGRIRFRNATLRGCDFRGASLASGDLDGADLTGSICDRATYYYNVG